MTKLEETKHSQSVWQSIFRHLKKEGFEVYSPGMKTGECTSKYIVVKNDGSSRHTSFSTDVDLYAVMCYVPKDNYSELESYVQQVKEAMKAHAQAGNIVFFSSHIIFPPTNIISY